MTIQKIARVAQSSEPDPARSDANAVDTPSCEALGHAVAQAIGVARMSAQRTPATTVPDLDDLDTLLDPFAPREQRLDVLRQVLQQAVADQLLADTVAAQVADDAWLHRLFERTLSWGADTHVLLANPCVLKLTIHGTTLRAESTNGTIVRKAAYERSEVALHYAEFLIQALGQDWSRDEPSAVVQLRSGTSVTLAREPLLRSAQHNAPGVLVVMQRARLGPWTMDRLVECGALNRAVAGLLVPLLHANCSWIITGYHDADQTALIEGLLSLLPEDMHVLTLDGPTPARATAPNVVMSRISLAERDSCRAFSHFAHVIQPLVLASADLFVVDEASTITAAPTLHLAETGMSTIVSVEASSPAGAIRRLARLAWAATNSQFGGAFDEAVPFIPDSFQILVFMRSSLRLEQPYIGEVWLIISEDQYHEPVLLPLVAATPGDETISWVCHASMQERSLVWNDARQAPLQSINERLADIPDAIWAQICADPLARPTPLDRDSLAREHTRLLRRARTALRDDEPDTAVELILMAATIRDDQALQLLIDEVLQVDSVTGPIDQALAACAHVISQALDSWQLDTAETLLNAAPTNIVVAYRRAQSSTWLRVAARTQLLLAARTNCENALQQAQAQRQSGDIAGALLQLGDLVFEHLSPTLQHTVLLARRALLSQLIALTHDEPAVQQDYVRALDEVHRTMSPKATDTGSDAPSRGDGSQESPQPSAYPAGAAEKEDHAAQQPTQRAQQADAAPIAQPGWLDAALARNRLRAQQRHAIPETPE
jgi:type IV secretory pathway ATPase VirB11/archaellum biosynthesis ATPase